MKLVILLMRDLTKIAGKKLEVLQKKNGIRKKENGNVKNVIIVHKHLKILFQNNLINKD